MQQTQHTIIHWFSGKKLLKYTKRNNLSESIRKANLRGVSLYGEELLELDSKEI